jgi:hypothetical protein
MVEKRSEFLVNVDFIEETLGRMPVNKEVEIKSIHKDLDPENEVNQKVPETYVCYICS